MRKYGVNKYTSRVLILLLVLSYSMGAVANLGGAVPSSYHPNIENGQYSASNAAHNWKVDFLPSGETVLQPQGSKNDYRIGIKLLRINQQSFTAPLKQHSYKNKLTYQWGNGVSEWWLNSAAGIEQWFKLEQAPVEADLKPGEKSKSQGVDVQLQLQTDLAVSLQGDHIRFTHPDGKSFSYEKLLAWDASGKTLPSRMRLEGHTIGLHIDDSNAIYPLTIDPTFVPKVDPADNNSKRYAEAYIEGGNAAVALSGDTLVVGWWSKDSPDYVLSPSENTGMVSVYTRSLPQAWTLQQTFEPVLTPAAHNNLLFGARVAIDGDVMAIGNIIYTRTAGVWTERAQLAAVGASLGLTDYVAISGDTIVIGEGYVFIRVGNTFNWSHQAQLIPSTTGGVAVAGPLAIDGDTIVIGHPEENGDADSKEGAPNNNEQEAGAAYVFTGSGNSWAQQAYLKAHNAGADDHFGFSVSISGDTIIAGAPNESTFTENEGAAYIFTRSGSSWSQQAYLKAGDSTDNEPLDGDEYGYSVDIDGDTVIVGAHREDSGGMDDGELDNFRTDSGAAYVYSRSGTSWTQLNYLKQTQWLDGSPDDGGSGFASPWEYEYFGRSVSIEGEIIAVGTFEDWADNTIGPHREAVTIFIKRYYIDVDVTGLPVGGSLNLINSFTGDDVLVSANGLVTLPTPLQNFKNYEITVDNTPTNPNYTCTVFDGVGFIQGAEVTVEVKCTINMHQLSGTISGLVGSGLVLQNNGGQDISLGPAANNFQFPDQPDGGAYLVSVANQPSGQLCTVTGGWGNINAADVTDVRVVCHQNQYSIKGNISGLLTTVSLINQETGQILNLTNSDTDFAFENQAENSLYDVIVLTKPSGPSQTCTINPNNGTVQDDVLLDVVCVVDLFRVHLRVYNQTSASNPTPFNGLVVQNNGGDDILVNNGGVTSTTHSFPYQQDGTPYSITVLTQPAGFNCIPTDGADSASGTFSGSDVTVNVRCFPVYDVTPNVVGNGSMSPYVVQVADKYDTFDFILTPDPGHELSDVSGCNAGNLSTLIGNIYTTAPVVADCTVTATFTELASACSLQDMIIGPLEYIDLQVVDMTTEGYLITNDSVVLNPGSDVMYTASDYIGLNAGFTVQVGALFTAIIRPVDCSTE